MVDANATSRADSAPVHFGMFDWIDRNQLPLPDLYEKDRHGRCTTVVTSQFPVDHWHEAIGDPTLADAILDRLLHNAYKMTLRGDAMRKRHATVKNDVPATQPGQPRRRCAPLEWQLSSG